MGLLDDVGNVVEQDIWADQLLNQIEYIRQGCEFQR